MRPEAALLKQVTDVIGVPPAEYSWTTYDEFELRVRQMGERALRAIMSGQLYGRLALRAYSAYQRNHTMAWHGSFRSPSDLTPGYRDGGRLAPVISPRQAFSLDGRGHQFAHAEPAIFWSATYEYPIVRSIITEGRVPDDFGNVALSKQRDKYGVQLYFTSQEYLDAVGPDVEGWVYGITQDSGDPDLRDVYKDWISGSDSEIRIHHDVRPRIWVRTGLADLPPHHLIILNGDGDQVRSFIGGLPDAGLIDHIDAYADSVQASTLSGYFPLETHPALTRRV